jgi:RNA-directed DNA polymerase
MACTTLAHLSDVDLRREAYRRTRKDGAPGIDGVPTPADAEPLEANLATLCERWRRGPYRAPPVRGTSREKEDGRQRPLGIPAFEDKIVQRAAVMLLGAIYAQDVWDGSHRFRPGRSPHQALQAWREQGMEGDSDWIVDAEVRACFDRLDHALVRERRRPRVADGTILGRIGKGLTAGVVEGETLSDPESGSPQGGVVSPLRAHVVRHDVLDEWVEREVRPRMQGRCLLLRCADDGVIGCERTDDARRMMVVRPKRFARFGLTIHPQKPRLVAFRKPGRPGESGQGNSTCEVLGCTHDWTQSRRGYWEIQRTTAQKRVRRAMKVVWQGCRNHRHDPLREQYRRLSQTLQGHYQDDGIRGNDRKLAVLYQMAETAWRDRLSRRSQQSALRWEKFCKLRKVYPLSKPRSVHGPSHGRQGSHVLR